MLGAVGWVKAYIWAVVYVVIFCAIGFVLAGRYALTIMQYIPVWVWPLCFVAVWIVSAIRRSGNKQLKVLLQKYLFTGFADKIAPITEGAAILGLTVVGGLIASVISYKLDLTFTMGEVTLSVQENLDKILPCMIPLGIVYVVLLVIR